MDVLRHRVDTVEREVRTLKADYVHMSDRHHTIENLLAEARGGLSTLKWVFGLGVPVLTAIMVAVVNFLTKH